MAELIKKLKPYNIKKGLRYLKHYGFKEFMVRLKERLEPEEVPYAPWYEEHKASPEQLEKQRKRKWKEPVTISIAVPVYKTPERFLRELIESLEAQSYPYWELCIANASPEDETVRKVLDEYTLKDPRIKTLDLKENAGIAKNTNRCFELATGEYIGLLDHDDLLAPDALYEVASAVEETGAQIIYTDEDKIDYEGKKHYQPHFKPDYSPDLLCSNNYICHFLVVKRSLMEEIGGFREGFDGAQDHDLLLRACEKAEKITHIPRILYHWRTHQTSTADNPMSKLYAYEAGKKAIEEHLARIGAKGNVSVLPDYGFYRVDYDIPGDPLVSILIPNKDQKDTLKLCIDSLKKNTDYSNYEVIIIENNSTTDEIFDYYKELEKDPKIRVITWHGEFNYSAINNFGAKEADGDYLLFLNNDIEILEKGWLRSMLGNACRPEVGAVGCKLIYPDNKIQHAGVIIGIGGIAGHAFLNMDAERSGYMHKASLQLNYSAVTAACMLMRKEIFDSLGGFEEELKVAFNDVDLCLRICKAGYLIVYDPFVVNKHYESKSRGAEDSEEKVRRFQNEIEYMRTHWIDILKKGDPYYNPNLTLSKWNYSLRAK